LIILICNFRKILRLSFRYFMTSLKIFYLFRRRHFFILTFLFVEFLRFISMIQCIQFNSFSWRNLDWAIIINSIFLHPATHLTFFLPQFITYLIFLTNNLFTNRWNFIKLLLIRAVFKINTLAFIAIFGYV